MVQSGHIYFPPYSMAQQIAPPVVLPILRKDEQAHRLTTVGICRHCYMTNVRWHDRPLLPYPSTTRCALEKCENETAYLIALERYDYRG